MGGGPTRRAVLLSFCAAAARAARGRVFPSEVHAYRDALTEFVVERLTNPDYAAWLPSLHCRAVSRRAAFIVYGSDRDGSPQLYRLDHKSGTSLQLTEAAALDRSRFTLLPGDRSLLYADGPSLRALTLDKLRERDVYRVRDGWELAPGFSVTRNGERALLVEVRDGVHEIRLISTSGRKAETVLLSVGTIRDPLPSPSGDEFLYATGNRLWLASFGRKTNRALTTAPGRIGPAYWAPDGDTVIYLRTDDAGRTEIRETTPETGADRLVTPGTRLAQFSPNGDGTVFAGACGSKAQPHIVLLLRKPQRELTLCEHRASRPQDADPVFSPDSQRVYFQSDAAGKPALYSVQVDRLIEPT